MKGFADVPDSALQKQLQQAAADAASAMRGYAAWLKSEKLSSTAKAGCDRRRSFS